MCAWTVAVVAPDGPLPLKNMFPTMLRQNKSEKNATFYAAILSRICTKILLYGAFSPDGMFSPCRENGWCTLALSLVGTSCKKEAELQAEAANVKLLSNRRLILVDPQKHHHPPETTARFRGGTLKLIQSLHGKFWLAWKWFNHATTHCSSWPTPSATTRTHLSLH